MMGHEVSSFERSLAPLRAEIEVFDLLGGRLRRADLAGIEVVLLGGSGAYSAAIGGPWFATAMDSLRTVHASGVPAFASCWGFQAMAVAMGGRAVQDRSRAEVGTHRVFLTPAAGDDPIFGSLPSSFPAQMGHEDLVEELPPRTTLLASSDAVVNQAYRFEDAPIYCTQFHPELDSAGLLARLSTYPRYASEVLGVPSQAIADRVEDTPEANRLVRLFVEHVVRR
ncbi:MAG: type 1 glutamine amidotransferase [Gemmatimonadetes bacterium]|nr:type 1 glutamine amidotransferase [Gemmatimonadota bacterium]MCY3610341.1 type 1 glutamine amidotransferase [Gemmatimonadota bacterium]